MKRTVLAFAVMTGAVVAFAAAPRMFVEPRGGFALELPNNWTVEQREGLKYRAMYAPPENNFSTNVNVIDEAFSGTLVQYVEQSLKTIQSGGAGVTNAKVFSRSDVVLNSGAQAVRLLITSSIPAQKLNLRQIAYLTEGNEKKFFVTCTALAASGSKFDRVCDTALKTFAPMFIENTAGFAIRIPPKWTVEQRQNVKYKMMFAPPENGFATNINVVDEKFNGSLSEYVEINLQQVKTGLPGFKMISRQNVTLNSGDPAVHILFTSNPNNIALRQNAYLTEGLGKKFVITCSALVSSGTKFDSICQNTAKTFITAR